MEFDLVFKNKPLNLEKKDWEENFKEIENLKSLIKKDKTDSISILYKIRPNQYQAIKLFGAYFVKKNKGKCNLEIKGKKYELSNYIFINNINWNNF